MDLFIIILFSLIIVRIKPIRFNEDYMSRNSTTAVKGIFAVIILLSHGRGYLPPPTSQSAILQHYSTAYNWFILTVGQLMVVMFLFYSGYGIIESYKKKKNHYIAEFLRNRVLKTFVHFEIAVILFIVLALVLSRPYNLNDYIFSLIGWQEIGNSNWFMFDIILLYLISYLSLVLSSRFNASLTQSVFLITVLSLALAMILYKVKPLWWCDTIMAFPAGMIWSVCKHKVEPALKNQTNWLIAFITCIGAFCGLRFLGSEVAEIFLFASSGVFSYIIVLFTMRFKIGNTALQWLGINAFGIYILQRIPMIIATELGINENPVFFMTLVSVIALIMASLFKQFTDKLDSQFKQRVYLNA